MKKVLLAAALLCAPVVAEAQGKSYFIADGGDVNMTFVGTGGGRGPLGEYSMRLFLVDALGTKKHELLTVNNANPFTGGTVFVGTFSASESIHLLFEDAFRGVSTQEIIYASWANEPEPLYIMSAIDPAAWSQRSEVVFSVTGVGRLVNGGTYPVPEPSNWSLSALTFVGVVWAFRRRSASRSTFVA